MHRFRLLWSAAFLAAVSSCSDVTGPRRSDLEANREKWRVNGFPTYTMTMTRLCFCGDVGPFNVFVNGSNVAATHASDGSPADGRFLPRIDQLFDFIEKAIADNAITIDVEYDPTLG